MKKADLYLELEELLECDMKTGKIKVDKEIFDDFVPNTYIDIRFVDTDNEDVLKYTMVAEDDDGIFMEYIGGLSTVERKALEYDGIYSDKFEN